MASEAQTSGQTSFKERAAKLLHEGNVRHVKVSKEGRMIVDLPLTIVVIFAVIAPLPAIIGVVVALVKGWRMEVENTEGAPATGSDGAQGWG
jgi:hypothetical protein